MLSSAGLGLAAVLLASIGAGMPVGAAPLGSAFTYQGQLKDAGQPATGLYDLQFCVFDTPASAIALACATDADNLPVEAGLFSATLDFGNGIFNGQERYLELRVRPGASTGGYTSLVPRQLIRPAPEALRANAASAAPWSGLSGIPAGFADGIDNIGGTVTSITGGSGLTGGTITTSGTLEVDSTVQRRTSPTPNCAAGRAATGLQEDGTPNCVELARTTQAAGAVVQPTMTLAYLAPVATVTITPPNQKVLVTATAAFGTGAMAATDLSLDICFSPVGGALTTTGLGSLHGLMVPANTRIPFAITSVLTLAGGTWQVGLCGSTPSSPTNNWNNGSQARVTALIL